MSKHNWKHDFIYEKAPTRWIDGVPLGNGYIGAMIWGNGNPLRINLDIYDFWEVREQPRNPNQYNYANIKKLVQEKKFQEISNILATLSAGSEHADIPFPTRLPLPRMEINNGVKFSRGRLRLKTAEWDADNWKAFIHATRRLFVIKGITADNADVKLFYPDKNDPSVSSDLHWMGERWGWVNECLKGWGYSAPELGENNNIHWYKQVLPAGGEYVIAWRFENDLSTMTVYTQNDAEDPLAAAITELKQNHSYENLFAEHCEYWNEFNNRSQINLPDQLIENLYYAEMYKIGSTIKPDGHAVSLCGLWSQETAMPYCRNDYTIDLNVQQAYWPIYTSNHLDLGHSLYNEFSEWLPRFQENAKKYYGLDDAVFIDAAFGYGGIQLCSKPSKNCGWTPMCCCPFGLAWISHNFWLHYKYSGDKDFLREKALPFIKGSWRIYNKILELGDDGKLHLPISHSPEYMECTEQVWQQDTSFEGALIRFLCQALIEADDVLKTNDSDRSQYENILDKLYNYPGSKTIDYAKDLPLTKSHRHPTQLMGVHPLDVMLDESEPELKNRIASTMQKIMFFGTGEWCGHGFGQMALISARLGYAEMAWHMLREYLCLVNQNSLILHGDKRKYGVTGLIELELTAVDSGFGAAAAVLEMLLQSCRGIIRVFPGVPEFWADVSFDNLLTEGGTLISAQKQGGLVRKVSLIPKFDGNIKLRNPFNGPANIQGKVTDGDILTVDGKAGCEVTLIPERQPGEGPDLINAGQTISGSNWFGLKKIRRF